MKNRLTPHHLLTPLAVLCAASLYTAHAADDKTMDGKMMMPKMSAGDKMMMNNMMMGMSNSEKAMMNRMGMMMPGQRRIALKTAPPAANAGLENATGFADVDVARGNVEIAVTLPPNAKVPQGSVLEGWLSTAGRKGGPGPSTASQADQKFGPAFGMEELAQTSRDIPYALSTGLLRRVGNSRTYVGSFHIDNPLTPYAAVAVTVESDGNTGTYDPRPGSPLMDGMIAMGMMMKPDGSMMGGMMGARLMMKNADGKMMPVPMKNGQPDMAMMDGKMMMMMMVMADGSMTQVKMMDGKMMMTMPNGEMAELKMDAM